MRQSFLTAIRTLLTLSAVIVACGGSFAVGYYAGYRVGWNDAWGVQLEEHLHGWPDPSNARIKK